MKLHNPSDRFTLPVRPIQPGGGTQYHWSYRFLLPVRLVQPGGGRPVPLVMLVPLIGQTDLWAPGQQRTFKPKSPEKGRWKSDEGALSTRNSGPSQSSISYWTSTDIRQLLPRTGQKISVQGLLQGGKWTGCGWGKSLEGKKKRNIHCSPQVSHRPQTIPQEQIRRSILHFFPMAPYADQPMSYMPPL
jgi:hypothetical protein